jgi:D-glycerate 3-kinase
LSATDKLLVVGICGAQGSGKTTLARAITEQLKSQELGVASLSLDDLYHTKAKRKELAATVHPLLRTRGVPGTHDVELGLEVLGALERGEPVLLPRFDKAQDDRALTGVWPLSPRACRVLIFEGWCVGAHPQQLDALIEPVNELERAEDASGIWRRYVNAQLAGSYQTLFNRIDLLALLAAPDFGVVRGWRIEQERELAGTAGPEAPGVMDETSITHFIQHYQRLTEHILHQMPSCADVVVRLDERRGIRSIS